MILLQPQFLSALNVGGKKAVLAALQHAIELEHSTIPPYLYALYSLDASKNSAIADIIKSVVVDEMLHMTLACNIINALGGSPQIDKPDFIPIYPGRLPGGVESDLTVHLQPCTPAQIKVFMQIEEPEKPLNFPVKPQFTAIAPPTTIGQFYAAILKQIQALGPQAFSPTPRHQIGPKQMPEAIIVTNAKTATAAINVIVEQGEGTDTSPGEVVGDDVAHYYRFAEIFYGRRLIRNPAAGPQTPPDQKYLYAGAPVPFDQTGIYHIPADPKSALYPPSSRERHACDTFNYTYTNLLKSLHLAFNGQPEALPAAIGLMMSLKEQAKGMVVKNDADGKSIGPSFEYQPINPGP